MKTYYFTLYPCVYERPELPEYFIENCFLSDLSESKINEYGLKVYRDKVDANNIQEALFQTLTILRLRVAARPSSMPFIACYRIVFTYFYGRASREKSFDIWTSRAARMLFLDRNRSYLTDEQKTFICRDIYPSVELYLND